MSSLIDMLLWNTCLAGALALVVHLAQRLRWLKCHPDLWHLLWLLVLVKLILPPIFWVPVTLQSNTPIVQHGEETDPQSTLHSETEASWMSLTAEDSTTTVWSFTQIAVAVSVCGTVILLVHGLIRIRRISQLVGLAEPGPLWMQEEGASISRQLMIDRPVSYRCVDGNVSPFLWVRKSGPVVILPNGLLESFERESLRLILRHELSHYVRYDHWTNAFSMTIGVLLWWNPVVWWARRELRFAQELCCDATVLSSDTNQRRRYAETLLKTVDFVASEEAAIHVPATAFGSCATLKRRIEMISRTSLPNPMPYVTRLLVLPLGALLIATSPTFAHDDAEKNAKLDQVQQEIHELRESLKKMESVIGEISHDLRAKRRVENRREERTTDDKIGSKEDGRFTEEQIKKLVLRAKMTDREAQAFYQLAEKVDFMKSGFKRLRYRDDLKERELKALNKAFKENSLREKETDEDLSSDKDRRLLIEDIKQLALKTKMDARETEVLYRLAERAFKMSLRDAEKALKESFNETALEKLHKETRRNENQEDGYSSGEENRNRERNKQFTREQLRQLALMTKMDERETKVLYQLAERVDLVMSGFKRLRYRDDLKDIEYSVLKKVFSVTDDHSDDRKPER